MATAPSMGKLIYHITSIDNLPSILKFGLLSRKCILQNHDIHFTDIADPEILVNVSDIRKLFHNISYFIFLQKIHLMVQCAKSMDQKIWQSSLFGEVFVNIIIIK